MRMTYNKIEESLKTWNETHPEITVMVRQDITGTRILTRDTYSELVYGETPGKCWDAWTYYKQGYNTAWRIANLGKTTQRKEV